MLSFDPKQDPSPPLDAATVIVLREGTLGVEAFCVRRHPRSSFLGGAVVFPGGKVDPSDALEAWASHTTDPHPRCAGFTTASFSGRAPLAGAFPGRAPLAGALGARTLAVTACRETLEESAILPLDGPFAAAEVDALLAELRAAAPGLSHDGAASGPSTGRARGASPGRRAPAAPTLAPLAAAIARRGRKLALSALVPWGRWITPTVEPRRFDARFFLLALPADQEGRHDEHETTMSFWARPADVLDRSARGEIFLAPPTIRALELLADARTVAQALAIAAEQVLLPICPTVVPADPPFLALPGDPAHEERERRVSGPTRFVLRDGRFVSEAAPVEAPAIPPWPAEPGA